MSRPAALLDIDGTLVDTNYHHALAWFRAMKAEGVVKPLPEIHRSIGMGGDQLLDALEVPEDKQEAISEREGEEYQKLIGEVELLPDAKRLVQTLAEGGSTVVLASSAKPEETDHYVEMLGGADAVDAITNAGDVESTKPEPDLVLAALEKAGGGEAVMVGDSTWDCEAAKRAGVRSIGILTGGFSREELTEAGASKVYSTLSDLLDDLEGAGLK